MIAVAIRVLVATIRAVAILALTEQIIARAPLSAITNDFVIALAIVWAAVWAITELPRFLTRRHAPAGHAWTIVYDATYFGVWAGAVFNGMTIPGVGTVLLGYLALAIIGYRLVATVISVPFKAASLAPGIIAVGSAVIAHVPSGPVPTIGVDTVFGCVLFGVVAAMVPTIARLVHHLMHMRRA